MTEIDPTELPGLCFAAPIATARWHQFDIGLERRTGAPRDHARTLFRVLASRLDATLLEQRLAGWFFMRKPPDIRFRLALAPGADPLVDELRGLLRAQQAAGIIRSLADNRYRPEAERFGGAAVMAPVHAWFHLDSRLWIELDRRASGTAAGGPYDRTLVWLFQDLFTSCLGEGGAAGAWRRLAGLVGTSARSDSAGAAERSFEPALMAEPGAAPGLADAYRAGNRRLARALDAIEAAAAPSVPRAQVLALLALFSFNRHGYPGERSGPLVAAARARFDAHALRP